MCITSMSKPFSMLMQATTLFIVLPKGMIIQWKLDSISFPHTLVMGTCGPIRLRGPNGTSVTNN